MYQKEIIYIGLTRNGEKIRNAGFVRVENREGIGRIFLQVQNIPHVINGVFPIRLHDGQTWKEDEKINIREGKGTEQIDDVGLKAGVQVQIALPEGYLLYGKSKYAAETESVNRTQNESVTAEGRNENETMEKQETESVRAAGQKNETAETGWEREEAVFRQERSEMSAVRETETMPVPMPEKTARMPEEKKAVKTPEEVKSVKMIDISPERVVIESQERKRESENTAPKMPQEMFARNEPVRNAVQKEDKWEQILDTYDRIHPYGDNRVYVKIEPKDFIILQEKYQHLVNNSFLLHGFYNYRYVILGKENGYYLGVPGVFYEREKMVAMMFGFEAFECEGGIAKPGGFGYYLRKVEL